MSDTVQNRLAWLDVAKGIGIVLVVVGHTAISVRPLIYMFHMPMFFILSGYLFNAERARDYRSFAVSRARRLLVPYAFFFLLSVPVAHLVSGLSLHSKDLLLAFLMPKVALQHPNPALWFFTALFWIQLIYAALQFMRRKWMVLACAVGISAVGCLLEGNESCPLSFIRSLYYVVFYAVGHLLAQQRSQDKFRVPAWIEIAVGMSCCVVLYVFLVKPENVDSVLQIQNLVIRHMARIGLALVFSGAVMWLSARMSYSVILEWLGKYTHLIFPLHIFSLEFFTYLALSLGLTPKYSSDPFCLAGSAFSLVILIPVVKFFSRNWTVLTGCKR